MTADLFDKLDRGAEFSACRHYRYLLWRIWDADLPLMAAIMLNPSTADETANDPTVERMERRARAGNFGGLLVGNAYGLRSTDPDGLYSADDPVGIGNDDAIERIARQSALVICGWGTHCDKVQAGRSSEVMGLIRRAGKIPHALALTKSGQPGHPLYLPYSAQPRAFNEHGELV